MARRWLSLLYVQVLIAVAIGVILGALWPEIGAAMKPLGDGFIKLIKMVIAPVCSARWCTGIASMGDAAGRPGRRQGAGLFRGGLDLRAGHRPGGRRAWSGPAPASTSIRPRSTPRDRSATPQRGAAHSTVDYLMNIIPETFVGAFAQGDMLQVLLLGDPDRLRLTRAAGAGTAGRRRRSNDLSKCFFGDRRRSYAAAPLGAFGAMAFTIGKYGLGSLLQPRRADGDLLPDQRAVRADRAGAIARLCGFSHLPLHRATSARSC